MSYISAQLRQLVIQRATERCEYCGLSQEGQEATFHIDHVIPKVAGGQASSENLALACVSCSLHKSAREEAIDPQSSKPVPLYNPRRDSWDKHFRFVGPLTMPAVALNFITWMYLPQLFYLFVM